MCAYVATPSTGFSFVRETTFNSNRRPKDGADGGGPFLFADSATPVSFFIASIAAEIK